MSLLLLDLLRSSALARVFGFSDASISRIVRKTPDRLPPFFCIGTRLRLRRVDIKAWLTRELSTRKSNEPLKSAA